MPGGSEDAATHTRTKQPARSSASCCNPISITWVGHPALDLHDAAGQIGLGLLRGLAGYRTAVAHGTVLAYAGPDVIDDLAWSA